EEGAGRHAVYCRVEADLLVHRQRREADVDPVEIAEEIGQGRERQDAQVYFAHGNLLERTDHRQPRQRVRGRARRTDAESKQTLVTRKLRTSSQMPSCG